MFKYNVQPNRLENQAAYHIKRTKSAVTLQIFKHAIFYESICYIVTYSQVSNRRPPAY